MSGPVQLLPSIVHFTESVMNNNCEKTGGFGLARCLFGVPDPQEVKYMLEEHLIQESQSFWDRWEILQPENARKRTLENEENEVDRTAKKLKQKSFDSEDDTTNRMLRRVLKPRNIKQRLLNDFWQTRKKRDEDKFKQTPENDSY